MNRSAVLLASGITLALVFSAAVLAQQGRPGHGPAGPRQAMADVDVADAQKHIRDTAQAIDADADGYVTIEEIQAHREQRRADRRAQRFNALDADGDGRVSIEEFEAPRLSALERADSDGDGVITRAERRAGRRGY